MQSDFESAAWADTHKLSSAAIARWIDKVIYAFQRLQAIRYDAPWQRENWQREKRLPHCRPN